MAHICSAFAAPQLLRPTAPPSSLSSRSICRVPVSPPRRPVSHSRALRVRMTADGTPPPSNDEPSRPTEATPTEKEDEEPKFSFWGVASFGIIFFIFMLSIVATLSRDFIPGGMTGPA